MPSRPPLTRVPAPGRSASKKRPADGGSDDDVPLVRIPSLSSCHPVSHSLDHPVKISLISLVFSSPHHLHFCLPSFLSAFNSTSAAGSLKPPPTQPSTDPPLLAEPLTTLRQSRRPRLAAARSPRPRSPPTTTATMTCPSGPKREVPRAEGSERTMLVGSTRPARCAQIRLPLQCTATLWTQVQQLVRGF